MTSRKPPPTDRPAGKSMAAGSSSGLTSDYLEAVKLLSTDTMTSACSLFQSDDPDSADKLLALYTKCQKAADVVARDAPAGMPKIPGLLSKRDSLTGGRAGSMMTQQRGSGMPIHLGPGGKIMGPTSKTMTTAAAKGRMMMRPSAVPMRGKMYHQQQHHHHHDSESSLDSKLNSNNKQRPHKMQRTTTKTAPPPRALSPTPPTIAAVSVKAPPPSALSFLAKLNKDKVASAPPPSLPSPETTSKLRRPSPKNSKKEEASAKKEQNDEEMEAEDEEVKDDDDDDDEMDEDNEYEVEIEEAAAALPEEKPTRTQPSRSSRRR